MSNATCGKEDPQTFKTIHGPSPADVLVGVHFLHHDSDCSKGPTVVKYRTMWNNDNKDINDNDDPFISGGTN